jgi:Holliday junction resolvase RusA-like endonuclease
MKLHHLDPFVARVREHLRATPDPGIEALPPAKQIAAVRELLTRGVAQVFELDCQLGVAENAMRMLQAKTLRGGSVGSIAEPGPRALRVVISGPPQAQQRVKATIRGAHAGVYEPGKSRSWKGSAKVVMQAAVYRATGGEAPIWAADVPLVVSLLAVFACPASDHRKREPMPRRWCTKANADVDNLAKAVLDAGNGVCWHDDRQVVELIARKVIGAQGEAPRVEVEVSALDTVP